MSLIVKKYGGSSVSNIGRIKEVARQVFRTREQGQKVVVVISAMGNTTEDLLTLAHTLTNRPDPRELDLLLSTGELVSCTLLAIALRSLDCPAISLTGSQAGIRTDTSYGRARISVLETKRIRRELEAGRVVVVAGFQGVTETADITTLGRGGSDTTAVALAAALGALRCEVYTDVEGIYTADPRIVSQAKKIDEIGYEEMLELASYGAKMHPRSIELAATHNVALLVSSSFTESTGTLIHGAVNMEIHNKVRGVTQDTNVAKITVQGIPDRPGIATALFDPLADKGISVDTIVQNASVEYMTDLTFTVTRNDLAQALEVIHGPARAVGAKAVTSADSVAKVSIVGTGMLNTPGYAALMFRTLYRANINIEMITTSEIRITCIVSEAKAKEAIRVLHKAFGLEEAD